MSRYRWDEDSENVDERYQAKRRKRALGKGTPPSVLKGRRMHGTHLNRRGMAKITFLSEEAANIRATALREDDGFLRHVYRCSVCSGWHLGSR